MNLYLVRHAHAGSRSNWSGDDRLRPLSKKGWRQAKALTESLADRGIVRLLSSPATRCVQSLEPLAERLGLPIEQDARLAEGSSGADALSLMQELHERGESAALSSHGDVIPELLFLLRSDGITFHDQLRWPKGSVWAVTGNGTHWTDAHLALTNK